MSPLRSLSMNYSNLPGVKNEHLLVIYKRRGSKKRISLLSEVGCILFNQRQIWNN